MEILLNYYYYSYTMSYATTKLLLLPLHYISYTTTITLFLKLLLNYYYYPYNISYTTGKLLWKYYLITTITLRLLHILPLNYYY